MSLQLDPVYSPEKESNENTKREDFELTHFTKNKIFIKDLFSKCDQETADLVTFTEEIFYENFIFCAVYDSARNLKLGRIPICLSVSIENDFYCVINCFKNKTCYGLQSKMS